MPGPSNDLARALVAESIVRVLEPFAESSTIEWEGRRNCVVSEALTSRSLLGDYQRIKADEQHMAFDQPHGLLSAQMWAGVGFLAALETVGKLRGTVGAPDVEDGLEMAYDAIQSAWDKLMPKPPKLSANEDFDALPDKETS